MLGRERRLRRGQVRGGRVLPASPTRAPGDEHGDGAASMHAGAAPSRVPPVKSRWSAQRRNEDDVAVVVRRDEHRVESRGAEAEQEARDSAVSFASRRLGRPRRPRCARAPRSRSRHRRAGRPRRPRPGSAPQTGPHDDGHDLPAALERHSQFVLRTAAEVGDGTKTSSRRAGRDAARRDTGAPARACPRARRTGARRSPSSSAGHPAGGQCGRRRPRRR